MCDRLQRPEALLGNMPRTPEYLDPTIGIYSDLVWANCVQLAVTLGHTFCTMCGPYGSACRGRKAAGGLELLGGVMCTIVCLL